MNYYYITGTSRGIGKAMAEHLLLDKENKVVGISRNNSITHKNYRHITFDLTDVEKVKDLAFEKHEDAKRICLINNAGSIGEIKQVGELHNEYIIRDYNVNLVTPSLLMNNFVHAYKHVVAEKIIVNMSSGAGKYPIDGWSVYCASKAALDMFSRVVDAEEKAHSRKSFRVLSIAPGVVDTEMQVQIRNASKEHFSRLSDFINYKKENMLAQPETIAQKYFHILDNLEVVNEVLISAKDY
jgi:benzil reductase ((S)-benzoin forming)